MKKITLKGKAYKNKFLTLLSILLRNCKWIILALLIGNTIYYWEQMSTVGLGDEETFWGSVMVVSTVLLFIFNKTWITISDKITDLLAHFIEKNNLTIIINIVIWIL